MDNGAPTSSSRPSAVTSGKPTSSSHRRVGSVSTGVLRLRSSRNLRLVDPPLHARGSLPSGYTPLAPARFGSTTNMGAVNPTPRTDEIVNRGDVWMAAFDHLRPVVVLSRLDNDDLRCVVAVEPANEDISGVAVEAELGLNGHVVRVALPRPGQINCTWVLTSSQEDLIEKVGTLSSAKLNEVENLILMGDQVSM